MATKTVQQGSGFIYRFTLKYDDTGSAVDLDDCTAITISLIRDDIDQTVLLTRTLALGTVEIITAASGIGQIYVNGTETVVSDANRGVYKIKAKVRQTDSDFTLGYCDYSGVLENTITID